MQDDPPGPGASGEDDAEAAMRRKLMTIGTRAAPSQPAQQRPNEARQRHRFVQDGEVPVTVLQRVREPEAPRPREGDAGLAVERAARKDAERALAEAREHARALQTKFEHAEIAHREALAQRESRIAQAEELIASLRAELAAAQSRPAPRARRVPVETGPEPEPVKWWLPNYGADGGHDEDDEA